MIESTIRKLYNNAIISHKEIEHIINTSIGLIKKDNMLLRVDGPTMLVGDIHGQFNTLKNNILTRTTFTDNGPIHKLLFLGDYVDRGPQSLETMILLLSLKCVYPESVYLLRGNHESDDLSKVYGFYDECKYKNTEEMWSKFISVFDVMPCAAIVNNAVFCSHGGIPRNINNLNEIENIKRPCKIANEGILCDLVWSDPSKDNFTTISPRGISYLYTEEIVKKFLNKFNLKMVCRGHEYADDGHQFWFDRKVITVFSAESYCGEENAGSIIKIDNNLICEIESWKPMYS